MKENSKKAGSILGLLSVLFKNIFSFFLTPLMIVVFGKGDFGVYKIVISTTGYFMLLDMGMHIVIVKYISRYKQLSDKHSQNKYIGLVQAFYIMITIIIIGSSIIVYNFIPTFFSNSLTLNEIQLFSKVFVLLTINSVVLMMFNAYGGIIKAHEKYVFFKTVDIGRTILRAAFIYFLLIKNSSVISVVLVDLFVNIIFGSIKFFYVVFKLNLRPEIKYIKKGDIVDVFSYTSFIFLNMIALQLFWASDNIILGVLTNSTLVAIYSSGTMINGYFQALGGVFSEFLMPSAVRMVENNYSKEEITNECARIGRFIFVFLGLVIVGFAFLGDKFIVLWLGEDFKIAYKIALIVMIPQLFTYSQHFAANIMWAKGKHKKRAIIMLIISLLNILITIILVKLIGIVGAAIGTSFAYFVGYLIYSSWYYHKHVDIDMIMFTKKLLKNIYIAFIPILVSSVIIRVIIPNVSWGTFFVQGVLITIVYCFFMYYIGMNNDEKMIIRKIAKNKSMKL